MTADTAVTLEKLREERRSYIIGSLVILCFGLIGGWLAIVIHFHGAPEVVAGYMKTRSVADLRKILAQVPIAILVWYAAFLALLFLNLRFSRIIERPRVAYQESPFHPGRVGWVLFLLLTFVLASLLLELIVLFLLASWGKQEIQRRTRVYIAQSEPGSGESTKDPTSHE